MNSFGNQVAVRVEGIPLVTAISPEAATTRLYEQALSYRCGSKVLVRHVVDLGGSLGDRLADLPASFYREFEDKCFRDVTADREDPDLPVMSARSPVDLSPSVLGSSTHDYLYEAGVPVLTIGPGVPLPEQPIRFQSIVYATDYSAEAARACVSAFPFAQDFGAQVYVCHVLPDPVGDCGLDEEALSTKFTNALRNLVPDVPPEWADPDCVLDNRYAAEGILTVAQRVKASLIVFGTRRARHFFDDSTARLAFQIISGSTCPVLSIQG
jgi:nucleotide-binding universal stress UspA family protein